VFASELVSPSASQWEGRGGYGRQIKKLSQGALVPICGSGRHLKRGKWNNGLSSGSQKREEKRPKLVYGGWMLVQAMIFQKDGS